MEEGAVEVGNVVKVYYGLHKVSGLGTVKSLEHLRKPIDKREKGDSANAAIFIADLPAEVKEKIMVGDAIVARDSKYKPAKRIVGKLTIEKSKA